MISRLYRFASKEVINLTGKSIVKSWLDMTDEQLRAALGVIVDSSSTERAIRERFRDDHGFAGFVNVRRSQPDSEGRVRTRITFSGRDNRSIKFDF